ncbi:hypothetical protein BD311DRAFT_492926 [Dichomitus squalens]|uniref:Uncharacterized protein n=1 Tax=Dichomitus squalens TaxID=114155 RepID=A0A4Q9ME51_9APHY|nr:hypothetical protein BD311DRAFT_492926 [Dichomitus squalens]
MLNAGTGYFAACGGTISFVSAPSITLLVDILHNMTNVKQCRSLRVTGTAIPPGPVLNHSFTDVRPPSSTRIPPPQSVGLSPLPSHFLSSPCPALCAQ